MTENDCILAAHFYGRGDSVDDIAALFGVTRRHIQSALSAFNRREKKEREHLMAVVSSRSQLAALDAAITSLRRGQLPPRSECALLADQLGAVRDRVASAVIREEEKQRVDSKERDLRTAYDQNNRWR